MWKEGREEEMYSLRKGNAANWETNVYAASTSVRVWNYPVTMKLLTMHGRDETELLSTSYNHRSSTQILKETKMYGFRKRMDVTRLSRDKGEKNPQNILHP